MKEDPILALIHESNERHRVTDGKIVDLLEKISEAIIGIKIGEERQANSDSVAEKHETRILACEKNIEFLASVKHVFWALIIALIIGSCTAVWNSVQPNSDLKKSDIVDIIKAINSNGSNVPPNIKDKQ